MIRASGTAGFQGHPATVASSRLTNAVAASLAIAALSLCLIVTLTVLSTKATMAMGLPVCGVDMMRSNKGPLVLEVNSSASLKTPEQVTGQNVAAKIIDYIE